MHTMAALGAALLASALIVPTLWFTEARAAKGPVLDDMETIEASLAYKKPNAPKQPQKQKQAPNPEVKPEGVSRDETKKVEPKEVKPEEKPSKDTDPLAKFKRKLDDSDIGDPNQTEGAADGSEFGRGNISKGDPYFQKLWADLEWTVPELAKTGDAETVACLVFTPDGKISKTLFKSRGEGDVGTLAESAIKALKAKRNETPEEVPTHLLRRLTDKGICFNLTAK